MSLSINNPCTVYKSTGSWYLLKTADGLFIEAKIKGKIKIDKEITSTNPLAVGDLVLVSAKKQAGDAYTIERILTRKNYIIRISPRNANQNHILASNLDQAIIIASIREPRTSSGFIDRFLITTSAYHLAALILFNKKDLLDDTELAYFEELKFVYEKMNYPTHLVSALSEKNMKELSQMLEGKRSLFCGHSGVGKSTLLNALNPSHTQKTGHISTYTGKGTHTTTFAEMFDLNTDTQIIDTPGVKEFALSGFDKNELARYMPDLNAHASHCRFYNCQHLQEPDCAVKQAVLSGNIYPERYKNYLQIQASISP